MKERSDVEADRRGHGRRGGVLDRCGAGRCACHRPTALVDVVDLGAEEGQGELAVLAELNSGSHAEETASDSDDDDGSKTLALVLGALGAGLGAVALIASLTRRRA
jgi:hypothetical protein